MDDDCGKNCKRIEVMEESSSTSTTKKRKIDFAFEEEEEEEELALPSLNNVDVEIDNHRFIPDFPEKTLSPASSSNSGCCCSEVSHCSSNESCEIVNDSLRLIDLKEKSFETENSTCIINNNNNNIRSRETTPSSEICGDSEEMDSPAKKPAAAEEAEAKMPSKAEIDEFFTVAEKYEQKRFAEKYNYDIVKDLPLEGRYKWVRLNQRER